MGKKEILGDKIFRYLSIFAIIFGMIILLLILGGLLSLIWDDYTSESVEQDYFDEVHIKQYLACDKGCEIGSTLDWNERTPKQELHYKTCSYLCKVNYCDQQPEGHYKYCSSLKPQIDDGVEG